jgi:hypothetical protein
MFAGQTNVLPYIRNYAEAHTHFTRTERPRSTAKWADNQRPLKNTRSWHYRIEQGYGGDHYDLCLYHTVMARFHKPDAEGVERRQYRGHSSNTSRGFMYDVLKVHSTTPVHTTDGSVVIMPVYDFRMPDSDFSVDAYFTADNRLIVERSKHLRHFKRMADAEDKAKRANAKKMFEPMLTLAAMRMNEWTSEMAINWGNGGAFQGAGIRYEENSHINQMYQAFKLGDDIGQTEVESFMNVAQKVLTAMVHVRADKQGLLKWGGSDVPYEKIDPPVKEREFINAIFDKVVDICHIKSQSGRMEYPQFPSRDEIVLSNICFFTGPRTQ